MIEYEPLYRGDLEREILLWDSKEKGAFLISECEKTEQKFLLVSIPFSLFLFSFSPSLPFYTKEKGGKIPKKSET